MDSRAQKLIDLQNLLNTIPKEHKKTVQKLSYIYMSIGAEKVLNLVKDLGEINPNGVDDYIITTTDSLDGG
jgi:hypothetical protein